jgi:hypothetical protein
MSKLPRGKLIADSRAQQEYFEDRYHGYRDVFEPMERRAKMEKKLKTRAKAESEREKVKTERTVRSHR